MVRYEDRNGRTNVTDVKIEFFNFQTQPDRKKLVPSDPQVFVTHFLVKEVTGSILRLLQAILVQPI